MSLLVTVGATAIGQGNKSLQGRLKAPELLNPQKTGNRTDRTENNSIDGKATPMILNGCTCKYFPGSNPKHNPSLGAADM
jgi:hypothetical protein